MKARADSTPARIASSVKVITIIRRRILSSMAPIMGNKCVIRKDSIRNSPMVNSTRMMTRPATSEVL